MESHKKPTGLTIYQEAILELQKNQDLKYKAFNQKLISTHYKMIGVRIPILSKMAKKIGKTSPYAYLEEVKYSSHEEILLTGLVIAELKEETLAYPYFREYLNHIDNWATCDTFCSHYHIIKKHLSLYYSRIETLVKDENPYIVRVGIVLLLNYYLNNEYINQVISLLSSIKTSNYYVKMALAWISCEIYIHYPNKKILKTLTSDIEIEKMTIRKLLDSHRVSFIEKEKIKNLAEY